jgi:hypothetical protein
MGGLRAIAFGFKLSDNVPMTLRAPASSSYIAFSVGLVLISLFHTAHAQRTIQVPGDVSTIQAGIDMSNTGDTLSVAPGTYSGPFDFKGKAITVSGSGPGVILDGGHRSGPVVSFSSDETRNSVLENVTVQNGNSGPQPTAGGIYISKASPTILNSIIQNNQGCGIGIVSGAPLIQGNRITGNQFLSNSNSPGCLPNDELGGGGIVLYGASAGAANVEIVGNTIDTNAAVAGAAGIYAFDAGRPFIENNTITHNMGQTLGSGIIIYGNTAPIIVQNLIYDNTIDTTNIENATVADAGAGLNLRLLSGSFHQFPTYIVNNTIAYNNLIRPVQPTGTQIQVGLKYDSIRFVNNLIVGADFNAAVGCFADVVTGTPPVALPTFDHNDVVNAGTNPNVYSGSCFGQTGENGNISVDPNFAPNPALTYPYQLQLPSSAIDNGNNNAPALPSLDFLGQPRLQNATGLAQAVIDIGAYEHPGIAAPIPPPPGFTLTVNPASVTVLRGGSGTFSVTVTPTAANLGSVLLTCSGLPATASCILSSSTLSFTNANSQSSKLTASIASGQSRLSRTSSTRCSLSMALTGIFLIPTLLARKRNPLNKGVSWLLRIGAMVVVFSCMGLSGCGPDRYVVIGPPQSYQLVIEATAVNSGLTKQTIASLVVTQ